MTHDVLEETIELQSVLKLAGYAQTGGEAKQLIQGGFVKVNGVLETRRKCKLRPGDTVQVGDDASFDLLLEEVEEDNEEID